MRAYTRVGRIIEETNYSGLKKFSNIQTLICIRTIARAMVLALLLLLGVGTSSAAAASADSVTDSVPSAVAASADSLANTAGPKVTPSIRSEEVSDDERPNAIRDIEVHFRFDKSRLDLNYMGNQQSLEKFAQVIDSLGLNMIDSVVIVSQSSPEGVYEHNLSLSRRRAATMRREIEKRHPDLGDKLFVHPDGESWQRLREYVVKDSLMKQSTIDKVLAVIDADVNIGTKKWRMEQLDIYPYLRKTYYPRIRNSVFCIVYFDDGLSILEVEQPQPVETEDIADEPKFREDFPYEQYTYRVPFLNVHSNMLYDAGSVLNVGVEYYPKNSRWTVAANYTFPWWSIKKSHRYLQIIDGQLEVRRYFKKLEGFDAEFGPRGHYLSAYGEGNLYDLAFNAAKRGVQGEGWSAGLGYGYVWHPWKDKRWKLEAFIHVGYYQTLYDTYHHSGDPLNDKYYYDWDGKVEDFKPRNHRLRWFGPTGVGINISYDLFRRKINLKRD